MANAGDYSKGFYDSDVIEGIHWSVQNEAGVINLSLGSPGSPSALKSAVDYAWEHGVVVVAATGTPRIYGGRGSVVE